MPRSQSKSRPEFKKRVHAALGHLAKAQEIAGRDHDREEGIASHDLRLMFREVTAAVTALEGPKVES